MQMIICVQSIAAVIWKGTDAEYNLYVSNDGMIPDTKQREFADKIGRRESFSPMQIEQAGSLVGIDACTSQSFSIVDTGQKDKFNNQQPLFKAVIK